jgi:hypothetical protein
MIPLGSASRVNWLDSLGRVDPAVGLAVPDPALADVADLIVTSTGLAGELAHVRLPGTIGGWNPTWPGPPPFG